MVSPTRTTSNPGPVFGPNAVRTNVTDSSEPSNNGWRSRRLAGTYSAAARSAPIRCNAMPISSLRWMRSKPRFQFGSHCAVRLASAESTSPINANDTRVSISVKPPSPARGFAGKPLISAAPASGEPL